MIWFILGAALLVYMMVKWTLIGIWLIARGIVWLGMTVLAVMFGVRRCR